MPFQSIFHYLYLIFTFFLTFPQSPHLCPAYPLYFFTYPLSIAPSTQFFLSFYLSLKILSFSRLLSDFCPPFLYKESPFFPWSSPRIPCCCPRNSEGKPKHYSLKCSSPVAVWLNLRSQTILCNQSSVRDSVHTVVTCISFYLLAFPVASLPASFHWISKKRRKAALIFLLLLCM